jgi:3-hydroxyisobutyrate dehydrogenase-like beta-hydroxyacid dehydrogenase
MPLVRVGVVGLGAMGSRIARRLLERGHDVAVWNRTPQKASALGMLGARALGTPGELARQCSVVITMVSDPQALHEIAEGPNGIACNLNTSSVWIEMSTVGPIAVSRAADLLDDDARFLEAPVLGSLSEVEEGSLVIFTAGPPALAASLGPLLAELGTPQYVGGRGAGAAAKLVANLALLGSVAVVGEAVALAEALGLAADATFTALASTPLAAQVERRRAAIASGHYPKRFALSLACKDARLITEAADVRGFDLRVGAALAEWFEEAATAGLAEHDYSAIIAHMLSRAPMARLEQSSQGGESRDELCE